VLAINVWNEQNLTRQVTVRTDGKISLPLIGDVQAQGRTPLQLEMDLTDKLKNFVSNPQVTVIVQEIHSLKFNILGQVTKPGSYPLTAGTTIVDAIAAAGGFKDFAKKKGVYVLRPTLSGGETRYDFNYQDFIKGKNPKDNIVLKSHDTVVVP
jgi:polysaccharide biosynthesis/export protein